MAVKKSKTKKRLTAHTMLMIFILFALACSVTAWFVNSKVAKISTLQAQVENRNLVLSSEITNIQFLTSTKINDTTKTLFNTANTGCVVKTYTLQGAINVTATVECTGPGMLAYVCYDGETDYYTKIISRLKTELGSTTSSWTYSGIQNALKKINNHKVSARDSNGNTTVKVVYWVEYEQAKSLLNQSSYWDSTTDSSNPYQATITFTA